MPRASFSDVSKGGLGFQEGRVLVVESYSTMYQFPPNSTTGEQSDAFPALVWKGPRLDDNGKPVEDSDGNIPFVEIVHRMGNLDEDGKTYHVRPGKLDPKDFDNMDVEPQDLGTEMGVKGNSFILESPAKFAINWGFIEESLKKNGFKADILGRCVTSDFIGLDAKFHQEAGQPYIAKKGKNKGKEVKPTNLVVGRVFPPYPYDRKPGDVEKILGGKQQASSSTSSSASSGSAAATASSGSASKPNGVATSDDTLNAVKVLFTGGKHAQINAGKEVTGLSPEFKAAVPSGKEVKLDDFRKAMVNELLRKKVHPKLNKEIMEQVIRKDDVLFELSTQLVDTAGAFMVGEGTITFS
jgi:hypothetical protein